MFRLTIALLAVLLPTLALGQAPPALPSRDKALQGVKSWGYQLQNVDPAKIAASPFDLVVIDYSRNGGDAGRFTKAEVQAMQRKPDGGRRIVLAYLSIGEAEDYRYYWNPRWVEPAPLKQPPAGTERPAGAPETATPETVRIPRLVAPGWLGRENERWHGNYHVRFWYDGWQDIIFYNEKSYLARIQEAGFDGVYLDRIDAYYAIEGDREDAARRMIDMVADFAGKARQRAPGFLIVAQNAEQLVRDKKYLGLIDGIAKEDLLFGNDGEAMPNRPGRVSASTDLLLAARAAGRTVLVVEYIDDEAERRKSAATLRANGFIPYFAPRKLDRLGEVPPAQP